MGIKRADLHGERNDLDRSVWAHTTPEMVNEAYGENFHPFAENGKFKDSKLTLRETPLKIACTLISKSSSVVNRSERVVASNVFEASEFPNMTQGRVALLGDGTSDRTICR